MFILEWEASRDLGSSVARDGRCGVLFWLINKAYVSSPVLRFRFKGGWTMNGSKLLQHGTVI